MLTSLAPDARKSQSSDPRAVGHTIVSTSVTNTPSPTPEPAQNQVRRSGSIRCNHPSSVHGRSDAARPAPLAGGIATMPAASLLHRPSPAAHTGRRTMAATTAPIRRPAAMPTPTGVGWSIARTCVFGPTPAAADTAGANMPASATRTVTSPTTTPTRRGWLVTVEFTAPIPPPGANR